MIDTESLDAITLDTVRLACKFSEMTDPGNEVQQEGMGVVDFITTEEGEWLARVFPATVTPAPITVPGAGGIQPTMKGAMVVLNQWLTIAVGQTAARFDAAN
jgi:hypothetical protein